MVTHRCGTECMFMQEKVSGGCKHSLGESKWLVPPPDLIWRVWTIWRLSASGVDRRLEPSSSTGHHLGESMLDCNRFEVLHLELGGGGECQITMETRWLFGWLTWLLGFRNTFFSLAASAVALLLSQLWKTSNCMALPLSLIILFSPFFLTQLSKAIITAPRCESVLAMADKSREIVSNDGSTSAETSQSCLFQQ